MGHIKISKHNHLCSDPVVKVWDQEIYSLCGLRFESGSSHVAAHMMVTGGLHSR